MVNSLLKSKIPITERELIENCYAIQGLSFAQLAINLGLELPQNPNQRKGWVGKALELALGADARNEAMPDFTQLAIELKTLPIASSGRPAESTFVTSIPLLSIHKETWETSSCNAKLKRILWIPVEGDKEIPYMQRRVGQGFLWSPNQEQMMTLANDWQHLTTLIITGQLETIDATYGEYLQIRPKAADGKALCYAFDADGNKVQTLPRGFYLRTSFTKQFL